MTTNNKLIVSIIILIVGLFGLGYYCVILRHNNTKLSKTSSTNSVVDNFNRIDYEVPLRYSPACLPPTHPLITSNSQDPIYRASQTAQQRLPSGWVVNNVCIDPSQEYLYILEASKSIKYSEIPTETKEFTLGLSKSYDDNLTAVNNDFRLYQYYIVTDRTTTVKIGDQVKKFNAGELFPLGQEIYWFEGLAGCTLQPGYDFSNGYTTLACGGGDNGCYKYERFKIDIFTNQVTKLGICEKNCDLINTGPGELTCTK